MAAVLAYAPDGVLSHRDAAALQGLRQDRRASVDVTVPRRARARPRVDVHVSQTLGLQDLHHVDSIRCTSLARTLVDLGDVVSLREVERAVEQAEVLRVFDAKAIEDVLERAGPRRGAGVLRRMLRVKEGEGLTANELEERFLGICRRAHLPEPAVNAWLVLGDDPIRADFLWRENRLIVETDGRATHATRQAFERDRLRDQRAMVAGYRVVRFSWRQVTRDPGHVASTVAALLGR